MRFSVLKSGKESNVRFGGFGYRSVTSHQEEERAGIPFSILPPFDKGRKFGAYNGHLHSSHPAATRAALAGISRPFKVTKSEEKSPSEFAFGRESAQKGTHAMIGRKWTREQ